MHPLPTPLLFAAVAALGAQATAALATTIYKCDGPDGTPVYQEGPCPKGKELRNFDTDPPNLSVIPGGTARPAPATAPRDARPAVGAPAGGELRAGKPARRDTDAAQRRYVTSGMSESEVRARLGSPDVTAGGKGRGAARWTYLPAPGDPDTITVITFANGTATGVERKVIKK
jgi:hypothetical protein